MGFGSALRVGLAAAATLLAATTAHGGGQRWTKDSAEYQTILKWIEGAKQQ